MKRKISLKRITLMLMIPLFMFGCKKEDNNIDMSGDSIIVEGSVVDKDGQPLNEVIVTAGSATIETDVFGKFKLSNAPVINKKALLNLEKDGYFTTYKNVMVSEGSNYVIKVIMLEKDYVGSLNPQQGGSLSFNGVELNIPANALNSSTDVEVYANYISPTDDNLSAVMPGGMSAVDEDGNQSSMISYGAIAMEIQDYNGNLVSLNEGSSANLLFPNSNGNAPTEIGLWYFDESLGYWVQSGSATLGQNGYQATIRTLEMYWNCDDWGQTAYVTGKVVLCDGNDPVSGFLVNLDNGNNNLKTYTNSSGNYLFEIPAGFACFVTVPSAEPIMVSPLSPNETLELPEICVEDLTMQVTITPENPTEDDDVIVSAVVTPQIESIELSLDVAGSDDYIQRDFVLTDANGFVSFPEIPSGGAGVTDIIVVRCESFNLEFKTSVTYGAGVKDNQQNERQRKYGKN
jgi:hypothetical protein